ncbi:MAG: LemA family protein [candidate division KSB1 bacterium]|nr:LemA family protein [candidate division KSB1 bacterium]MDZ7368843.1 LemA family protein [candidate division KSB1 bacterium]MDZ7407419.1 LemA family protein [candidate division KSB1 bacterium]
MSKGMKILAVVAVVAVILGWKGCSSYNNLVGLDESVNSAWAQVQNQYQRRADLIPNLVETVKGAANFERETLEAVIQARASATRPEINAGDLLNNPQAFQQFQQAQDNLGAALGRLLVVVERYPELKANQNYRDLQTQLEGTENRISVERKRFNEVVQNYNSTRRVFPTNIFAGMFGFQQRPYFEATTQAQEAPKVDFGGNK